MALDTHAAAEFYLTPRGAVAAHLLRQRLMQIWPRVDGQSVLGLGYAVPYLRVWREHAGRCIALTPAQLGAASWPPGGPGLACTAEEDALPFADLSFDRVVLVHGLEAAEHARRMLREVWRVLKDDGRVLIVAPNRTGLWAHLETTPFGHGQPYSPGQIERLLTSTMFAVERRDTALYLPPVSARMILRSAGFWEKAGRAVVPRVAGVTITEARKDLFGTVPLTGKRMRRMVLVEAA